MCIRDRSREEIPIARRPLLPDADQLRSDVAHVDPDEAALHHRGDLAPVQIAEELAHLRRCEVVRSEERRRVDDHRVEPPRDTASHFGFAGGVALIVVGLLAVGGAARFVNHLVYRPRA